MRVVAVLIAAAVAVLTGCGGAEVDSRAEPIPPSSAGAAEAATPTANTVAEAVVPTVTVFAEPGGVGEPAHELAHPTDVGAPLVFLVEEQQGEWLRVLLPVRPNGSEGWVRASDVTLSTHPYRIEVSLSAFRIKVFEGDTVIVEEPVGVGTGDTPTPNGRYYIKELLQPPNPGGAYGPFAYGLSGFSNQLTSFAGGDGVIGIHGTNDPSSLGRQVSHGCIRMSNEGITRLAGILPLGVPVEILS
jgi:lipoprotein-anchoring transpeptidase ErfK/SrfK